jgi:hypothetical protein
MQENNLEDYAEHYQNAKAALNESYALSIANGKGEQALKMATLASNECAKFLKALRLHLEASK